VEGPGLRVRGIARASGGVAARGNGSGKPTLIKVMSGVLAPERGVVEMAGVPQQFRTAADAHRAGVAAVHQELARWACPSSWEVGDD
jgi:ABC-type sugar transport system ATPase subunit